MLKVELDSLDGCGIGGNRIISSRILQQNLPAEENDEYGDESIESEDQLI